MSTLVLYDSLFGDTAQIALAVAGAFGHTGNVPAVPVQAVEGHDIGCLDLLVIGCPTHYHGLPTAVSALLERLPPDAVEGRNVAVFDTRYPLSHLLAGSAAHVLAAWLRRHHAVLVRAPESFFVTVREGPLLGGEIERAAQWGHMLVAQADRIVGSAATHGGSQPDMPPITAESQPAEAACYRLRYGKQAPRR